MYKSILGLALVLLVLAACKSKTESGEDKQASIISLNNLYDSAIVKRDTGVLKRLYADDFVYTNPEGKLLTRDQQITSILVSEMNWAEGRSKDVKVNLYGDVAVMTGAFLANGNYRGNPVTIHERYTTVWVRTDTTWKIVAEQGNIIQ
jgi:ketosteroid isomerase-like protein